MRRDHAERPSRRLEHQVERAAWLAARHTEIDAVHRANRQSGQHCVAVVAVAFQQRRSGDPLAPERACEFGKEIERRPGRKTDLRVIAYNKPAGELVTRRDPEGRRTVFARLPRLATGRWISVGRLDINTSGLLLLTNNGELANRLTHPSRKVEREYAVRILGEVPDEVFVRLTHGVELEDGSARFEEIVESEKMRMDATRGALGTAPRSGGLSDSEKRMLRALGYLQEGDGTAAPH